MTSGLLPPSPNWYCSRATDTSQDGVLGFATKNTVFLLNVKTNPPSAEGTLLGHSERVTGLSFCSAVDHTQQCATSSDDCTVKLWDVSTKTVVKEHKVHQFKVTTLHWSPLCKDLIVSGDEKGALVCWDLASNDSKLYIPETNQIFSLSCSPHNASHVAVGYKNALVLLVDIANKGSILHRLRGHEEEIHSICWAPSPGESLLNQASITDSDDRSWRDSANSTSPEQKQDGCLLLTGSKDRTIRVWGTSNGKLLHTLRLPAKGFQRSRDRGDDGGKGSRVWVGLYWLPNEEKSFICSSHSGDIVRWDLGGSGKPRWEYFGSLEGGGNNMHLRIAFNISCGPSRDTFITTSMDRKIICWNVNTREPEWCLPSLGGFVYCIAASPLDQSRLAIGVGDNMIRVWNTGSPANKCDVTVLWQGIKSKVTAVCWHPKRENCLAYATDEGRVGMYNSIAQTNKPPLLASTFHKKTVYSLSWGPACPAKKDGESFSWHLYSCGGGGVILQHDPSNLSADAVNVGKLIRDTNNIQHILPQRTDVSWRSDGRAVAMGNGDGSVDVFRAPDLLLLCTIHVHHKLINCLKWYPQSGFQTNQSQHEAESVDQTEQQRYWLASGSNDPHVHVYDLSKVLGPKDPVQLNTSITNSMCCLSGHTLRVTGLSWNPHGNGHLVSVSYDGTAQVWDVLKGEPIANYRGHMGRAFTCQWSALQEDSIYTGSEDFTVRKWNISQCEHKCPPKKKKDAIGKTVRYQSGDASNKSKKNKKSKPKRTAPAKSEESSEALAVTESVAKETTTVGSTLTNDTKDVPPVSQSETTTHKGKDLTTEQDSVSSANQAVQVVNEIGEAESSYLEEAAEGVTEPSYLKIRKDRGKKKKQKSLFPVSSGLDNRSRAHKQADCVQLAAIKYGGDITKPEPSGSEDAETTHLGFFCDRKAMYDLLKEEAANHSETGYFEQKHTLGLWKGSILMELEEAKQNGTLSDMMVAMASMGGPDIWLEVCEAYAQQLEKNEYFVKAANYYIACHQVNKAIQVLMNNRYYREAAAIATLRLPSQDPLLTETYSNWAAQLEKEGNFEQASKCFLAIDQPGNAIRLLCKKGDPSSLRAGLEVAILAQQETMATRLMGRYVNECMLAFDWSQAQEVRFHHDLLQAGQLLLQVHETLTACWLADKVISPAWYEEPLWSPWQQILTAAETEVLDNLGGWSSRVVDGKPVLQAAIKTWAGDHKVDLSDKDYLAKLYNWIEKTKPQGASHNLPTKQLLIYLSNEVILGQLCVYMDNMCQAAIHWLQALVMCHNIGEYEVARGLCTLILPKGRGSLEELKDNSSSQDNKKTGIVLSCLEAYYSLTSLYHLWWDCGSTNSNLGANQRETMPSGCGIGNTKSSDVISSLDKHKTHSVKINESSSSSQVDCVKDADSQRTNGTIMQQATSCITGRTGGILSLCAKLRYMSEALLSEPHAKHDELKHKLTRIQQAVGRLVAKHSAQGSPQKTEENADVRPATGFIDNAKTNAGCEVSVDSHVAGDNNESEAAVNGDSPSSAKSKSANYKAASSINHCDNTVDDKTKSSNNEKTHDPTSEEDPLPDTLLELTAALNGVLKEIDLIPAEIKDNPFPDPFTSAMTLLYFTKQTTKLSQADGASEELQDLCRTIAEWGHTHSFIKRTRDYFAKHL